MANQIRISTSCQIVNDNSVANEGSSAGDYTNLNLDVHSDSRTWGGSYNISTAYDSSDVCYWKNAVVDITSAGGGLGDSVWNKDNVSQVGTIPTTAHVVAVEYASQLGTVANITVNVSGEILAFLTPGEAIVLPLHMGEAVADIEVFASAYSLGVHEATVNVMIAGV